MQDAIISNIKEDLTNNFNTSDVDKGQDIIIEEKGTKLTITTTDNQKNSEKDKNSTTINLGECETKLKEYYKIPLDKSLYILKLDVTQEGMKIPKIEYEVYYNLNGNNLEKLNLSVCENTKVELSIPAEINEDIDKLNSSSAYFNDICYTSTSDSGADISLADRKKEFIENNKTLCEENCEFTKYNYETGKAICSCNIKINIPLVSEISIDKNKLFNSFTDINNIINYKVMKCYKNLLDKKSYTSNYGSFILIPIIIFHLISLFSACAKGNKHIKYQIKEIYIAKIKFKYARAQFREYQEIINLEKDKIKNKIKLNKEDKNNVIGKKLFKKGKKKLSKRKKLKYIEIDEQRNTNNSPPIKSGKKSFKKKKNILETANENKTNQNLNFNNKAKLEENAKKYIKYKELLKPNENELNELPYVKALNTDKRTYCQYYCSLLKTQHLLLFAFLPMNDYNLRITKVDLFFISFAMNFTVNALFFNDETMHQIYEDGGKFNLIYQIPQILYSSLISTLLFAILKLFALTENNVLEIKHEKENKGLKIKKEKIYKILNIKFLLFFITSFVMLSAFLYYVVCFCAIYKNTQIHLIKDTLVSFALSMIYPFLSFLLPGILRIPSLSNKNNKRELLYKLSKFLQMLLG